MDFSFTEEQEAVRELAARILGDLSTPERLKEVDETADRFDRSLWKQLGTAGLLSVALPESCGGAGLGLVAAGIVAEEIGRVAAAVPYSPSVVWAGMPVARFGNADQHRRWLEPMVSGDGVLTAALNEPGGVPWQPGTVARRDGGGGGWVLDGTKSHVPAADVADAILVPARCDTGGRTGRDTESHAAAGDIGLFVVERDAPGVRLVPQEATDRRREAEVELSGVRVGAQDVLVNGPEGATALEWLVERAQATTCLEVAGACEAALRLTAEYTSGRQQFGKAIATFQAVGQRAADAYIDAEGVRLTAWQAVWRLSEELPASAEVAVAKYWADEGAQRVVHAAQHLHGGIGVDRDYPLHRYFLLVKHLGPTLGGTTPSLLRLGDLLAAAPA